MNKTIVWIYVIMFIAGMFIGYVGSKVICDNEFRHEFTVRVQPMAYRNYPYRSDSLYLTTLPYELHRVTIRNGNVVNVERIGYAFKDKM